MRKTLLGAALLLCMGLGSFFLVSSNALHPGITPQNGGDDPLRALYEDDKAFEQLSGTARSILELKFGRKDIIRRGAASGLRDDEQREVTEREGVAPGEISDAMTRELMRGSIQPLAALANQIVNDPTADLTAQDTQSETSIAVAVNGNIIASFNDSGSFTGSNAHFTGYSLSTNGGMTFVDKGILPEDPTGEGDAGDPIIGVDRTTGRIYLVTLGFQTLGKLQVFRSDDNGQTFQAPVNGTPGSAGQQDKEWVAVDNFAGTGQGNVYLGWRNFGSTNDMRFTRSTDGGNTFGGNLSIAAGGQGAFVTVGPDHSVYYFWYNSSTAPRRITMRKSTDFGVTFGPTITVANLVGIGTNGDLALTGGFRSNTFPQVGVNPVSGHLYCVFNDVSATTGGDRGNIFLATSTDGGTTWGTPAMVNDDGTTTVQSYQPVIAVRPDGSGLFIGFYDRRRDPNNMLIDVYGAIGSISGGTVTLSRNFRITTQSFPVVIGVDPVINTVYMGDYDQAVADNTNYYYTWGDNRDRNLANTRFNANVRFAAIPLNGPGAILEFNGRTVSDMSGNGNGAPDPGETVNLTINLLNSGTSMASGISSTLTTTTPGVTISPNTSAYPDIPSGGNANNATPFGVSVASSVACGSTISFTLNVATTSDGMFSFPFTVQVGAPTAAYTADFQDGSLQGFTVTNVTGLTPLWHVANNVCQAGAPGHTTPFTLYYGQDSTCNYNTGAANSSTVTSPMINLTGFNAPFTLSFNYLLQVETLAGFDQAFVDISTNGGTTFTQVLDKSGLINNNTWQNKSFDITTAVGAATSIMVRFRFNSVDGILNATTGWHVDDIMVLGIQCGAAAPACPVEHTTIYASDTNNSRIQRSTNDGSSWQSVGFGPGTTLGKFNAPRGVASDTSDTLIFVADTGNNRIQRSSDGGITW
ncbi:MAG: hypothetical protein AB1489_06115, partial [Acidobacteriota bacterium]